MLIMSKKHYKTVLISDIHLGNPKNQWDKLVDLLSSISTDQLIICGDFIDFWQLDYFGRWTDKEQSVLDYINQLSGSWTKIIYIQGNHDNKLKCDKNISLNNFSIMKALEYTTWWWKKYFITHGDSLDSMNSKLANIWKIWTFFYWLFLNIESIRNKNAKESWSNSFSQRLEYLIRVGRFSKNKIFRKILRLAKNEKSKWIILWHFHWPMHETVDWIEYFNTWDRINHCSYIVENMDWTLELQFYDK